jgi:hypothetical protein
MSRTIGSACSAGSAGSACSVCAGNACSVGSVCSAGGVVAAAASTVLVQCWCSAGAVWYSASSVNGCIGYSYLLSPHPLLRSSPTLPPIPLPPPPFALPSFADTYEEVMQEEFNAMRAAYESKLRAAREQMQAFEKDRASEVGSAEYGGWAVQSMIGVGSAEYGGCPVYHSLCTAPPLLPCPSLCLP